MPDSRSKQARQLSPWTATPICAGWEILLTVMLNGVKHFLVKILRYAQDDKITQEDEGAIRSTRGAPVRLVCGLPCFVHLPINQERSGMDEEV